MIEERRSNAPSTATSPGRFAKPPRKLVAGEHHVRNAAHQAIEKLDGKTDRARRDGLALRLGNGCGDGRGRHFRALLKRLDQGAVVTGRPFFAGVERGDHLCDAVDDGEHCADQRGVGLAAAGANFGERILGRMAQRLEPREVEEAAIAFDGVDEAENGIEPRAVVRRSFPCDDLAAERLEHLPAFGNEFGNQIVHRRAVPSPCGRLMARRS